MSWAAFCTELLPQDVATYRIQALDCDVLLDRLKLAAYMLRQEKSKVRRRMKKAGLRLVGEDELDNNDDDNSATEDEEEDDDTKK